MSSLFPSSWVHCLCLWLLAGLLLLPNVEAALVSHAKLTDCSASDPTGCSKQKLEISLTVDSSVPSNSDVFTVINTAMGENDTVVLFDPLKVDLTRSPTSFLYPITYIKDFNGNPHEETIQNRGCLKEGDLWYKGYSIGTNILWYTVSLSVTSLFDTDQTSTLNLNTDQPYESKSSFGGLYGRIAFSGAPSEEPAYLMNKFLFIPSSPTTSPIVQAGLSEYMILPKSMVTLDGSECNKVGVSYNTGTIENQCHFSIGDCLGNQLNKLREDDQKRVNAKATPLYMALRYGDFFAKDFDFSGVSSPYLGFSTSSPESASFVLSINADDLHYVTSVANGEIVSAKMTQGSVVSDFKDAAVSVQIKNTGDQAASYFVSVESCTPGIEPFTEQRTSLEVKANGKLNFIPQYNSDLRHHLAECEAVLYNGLHQELSRKWMNWVVTDINEKPDIVDNANKTCSACKLYEVGCAHERNCTLFLWQIVFMIAVLMLAALLLAYRRAIVAFLCKAIRWLRQLCCDKRNEAQRGVSRADTAKHSTPSTAVDGASVQPDAVIDSQNLPYR